MKGNCLDIGTIQAFLDGELPPAASSDVSRHIAGCDSCAMHLASAEEESTSVFAVLEREMNTLVPTQRLWNRINDSIATEKQNAPFWQKAWAFLTVQLANPSIAVAASVVVVFGLFTVVWVEWNKTTDTNATQPIVAYTVPVVDSGVSPIQSDPVASLRDPEFDSVRAERASYIPEKRPKQGPEIRKSPTVQAAYLPGEDSYVKTINTLSQTVSGQKDSVMRPSERVAYERDMAFVDDAITKLKKEVRKNPKNESAKQVLYTSYQNKIDLLSSVSQREELMASLK